MEVGISELTRPSPVSTPETQNGRRPMNYERCSMRVDVNMGQGNGQCTAAGLNLKRSHLKYQDS